jgi:hypothetical protein
MRILTITVGNNRVRIPCHRSDGISISVSGKTHLKLRQDALNSLTFVQKKAKGI